MNKRKPAPAGQRWCPTCNQGKGTYRPLSEFHKDRHRADGLRGVCKACTIAKRHAYYDAHGMSDRERYNSLRRLVLARGMRLMITFEQFQGLRNGTCAYGAGKRPETKIGIDRKDNTVGYTPQNCVPCCFRHNEIKSDIFSHSEMLFIVANVKSAQACGNGKAGRKKQPRIL